ncbi:MAG TPA: hypothetical protein VJ843_01510 [Candidatus Saccharimonadales bacterium]|nr:hypothetical protein [Candidatus Saccharimonadales bacterium]
MVLQDIEYFAEKQWSHPEVFDVAQRVYDACLGDTGNNEEMQRRLAELSRTSGAEHLRQAGNFMAEIIVFSDLLSQGFCPRWLPESRVRGVRTPDIEYIKNDKHVPVEVKHLNDPRDEHEAIYAGRPPGGSVGLDYYAALESKVEYFVNDAMQKFACYKDSAAETGIPELHLFFTKSLEAKVADIMSQTLAQFGDPGLTMKNNIEAIAQNMVSTELLLKV